MVCIELCSLFPRFSLLFSWSKNIRFIVFAHVASFTFTYCTFRACVFSAHIERATCSIERVTCTYPVFFYWACYVHVSTVLCACTSILLLCEFEKIVISEFLQIPQNSRILKVILSRINVFTYNPMAEVVKSQANGFCAAEIKNDMICKLSWNSYRHKIMLRIKFTSYKGSHFNSLGSTCEAPKNGPTCWIIFRRI